MFRKVSVMAVVLGSLAAVGCSNADRSLCLFTDTTVGFQLSFDSKSATPAKTILGYNRSEGLMNPVFGEAREIVYDTEGTVLRKMTITPHYRPEAYSVIVKMNGHKQTERVLTKEEDKRGGQLFVTGKAALLMAQNPVAVAALMDDPSILQAVAQAAANQGEETEAREATETVRDEVVGTPMVKTASTR